MGELVANGEWQIINDSELLARRSHHARRRIGLRTKRGKRKNTNRRILEWIHILEADEKEAQSIQQIDVSAKKHVKSENLLFGWTATDRPLEILEPHTIDGDVDKNFCSESGCRTYSHWKFNDEEAQGSERDQRPGARPGGVSLPLKEISRRILKFRLDKTSAICITADMSFNTRLEVDFKREYQNVEFLFRQRPGVGGMAALPPSVSHVPGKYLCFLVTRTSQRNVIDPELVVSALTRLRDFLVERGMREVSRPVYEQRQIEP